ncbi:hypothetical protein EDM22_02505 [Agromyces tardus]|jgi:hypothetical protein|uniref:Uncharacterized protein n=1 Tax=Agromyces tardus TaxID=2583849 RepID=A0A3M8AKV3_9MICO|nr:hypothetical protein [Agromyces tardus]RNB51840.1 hypothetical protein EDM22_02505 [Agromyces tardus]
MSAPFERVNVEKRPAYESPASLARPVTPPTSMRRPAATAVGSVLVVLRVIAGIVWLVSLWAFWDELLREQLDITVDPGTDEQAATDAVLAIILVFGAIVLVVELGLAVLVWFGSNWARIAVMLFATISITSSWVESVAGNAEITLRTTLVTLALDILVLLALSSRNARAYARRPRQRVILHRK